MKKRHLARNNFYLHEKLKSKYFYLNYFFSEVIDTNRYTLAPNVRSLKGKMIIIHNIIYHKCKYFNGKTYNLKSDKTDSRKNSEWRL